MQYLPGGFIYLGDQALDSMATGYRITPGDGSDLYVANCQRPGGDLIDRVGSGGVRVPIIAVDDTIQDVAYSNGNLFVLLRETNTQDHNLYIRKYSKEPNDVYILQGSAYLSGWTSPDGIAGSMEFGPDGLLYVSNGDTGAVRRVTPTGFIQTDVLPAGAYMDHGGFILFQQAGFTYQVVAENASAVSGFTIGDSLYGVVQDGLVGSSSLTVRAYDHLGRSGETTVNVHSRVGRGLSREVRRRRRQRRLGRRRAGPGECADLQRSR